MNIGLVLSGGVAKGAYQAGFLKAVKEIKNSQVTSIACASIGVLNGYAYSANKVDKLCELWESIHFDSTSDYLRAVCFKHLLRDVVHELVDPETDVLELPVYTPICYPFPIPRMRYYRLQGEYLKKWYSFMRGAMAFPVVGGLVRFHRGWMAIDGGAMDNIPIQPLLYAEKPDLILVLHFEAGFRPRKRYLEFGVPIIDYDVSLHNDFRKYSFSFHSTILKEMLEGGYEYGKEICGQLFGAGNNDLQTLLEEAEKRREEEETLRISNKTFDTLVQRLNEFFYPTVKENAGRVFDLTVPRNRKVIYKSDAQILAEEEKAAQKAEKKAKKEAKREDKHRERAIKKGEISPESAVAETVPQEEVAQEIAATETV